MRIISHVLPYYIESCFPDNQDLKSLASCMHQFPSWMLAEVVENQSKLYNDNRYRRRMQETTIRVAEHNRQEALAKLEGRLGEFYAARDREQTEHNQAIFTRPHTEEEMQSYRYEALYRLSHFAHWSVRQNLPTVADLEIKELLRWFDTDDEPTVKTAAMLRELYESK